MTKRHALGQFVSARYGGCGGRVEDNATAGIKNVVVFDSAPRAGAGVARLDKASPYRSDRGVRSEANPAEPNGDLFAIGGNDSGLASREGGRKEAVLKFAAN